MTAKTPIYMQDELEHANKMRERMVPQIEAARAMLAALKGLMAFDGDDAYEYDRLNDAANAAIAQAEAAGIGEK